VVVATLADTAIFFLIRKRACLIDKCVVLIIILIIIVVIGITVIVVIVFIITFIAFIVNRLSIAHDCVFAVFSNLFIFSTVISTIFFFIIIIIVVFMFFIVTLVIVIMIIITCLHFFIFIFSHKHIFVSKVVIVTVNLAIFFMIMKQGKGSRWQRLIRKFKNSRRFINAAPTESFALNQGLSRNCESGTSILGSECWLMKFERFVTLMAAIAFNRHATSMLLQAFDALLR